MGNPSANLLYPVVNKEVAFLGEGHDIVTRETCIPTSLNVNNLGKAAVLHFCLLVSSVAEAMPNQACRSLSTTVLMASSHRFLIISPHKTLSQK
jgi:hypothetical protein